MNEKPAFDVEFYKAPDGTKPAAEFLSDVSGTRAEAVLKEQLYEFQEKGLHGDIKPIKGGLPGLREFRNHSGPGYRIYFMEKPGGMVVFGMSDKGGQDKELSKVFSRAEHYQSEVAEARKLEQAAAELERAAKDSGRKFGRHNVILAIGTGAVVEAITHDQAQAAQATADMMPFARVAAAPNSSERTVRAIGDSGLALTAVPVVGPVLGPTAELVTGAGEEVIRFGNDMANTVGWGSPKIERGLVMTTVDMARSASTYTAAATRRWFNGDSGPTSEPVLFLKPSADAAASATAATLGPDPQRMQGRRDQAPLNARMEMPSLVPDADAPPKLTPAPESLPNMATTKQPQNNVIKPPAARPATLGANG